MGFLSKAPLEETAWARATALGTFTHAELASQIGCEANQVGAFVRGWEAQGWVKRLDDRVAHARFQVVAGPQPEAASGGSREANMWRVMRGLPVFTAIDVAAHADTGSVKVTSEDARAYIGVLFRHGYLKCLRKADPSKGREASYKLLRNSGPKAPVLQRIRAVYDPNTGEHVIREVKL